MRLTDSNFLLASLLGSKTIGQIDNFSQIQSVLIENDLPTLPIIQQTENGLWQADEPLPKAKQFFPFTFANTRNGDFTLPFEPMLSISSQNNISEKNVAKQIIKTKDGKIVKYEGTVKERWSRGDYELKLSGVLIDKNMKRFPREYFTALVNILTEPQLWNIYSPPLELLDIHQVVVYDFNLPFTKGENVQAYEITLKSDFQFRLELTEDDIKQP